MPSQNSAHLPAPPSRGARCLLFLHQGWVQGALLSPVLLSHSSHRWGLTCQAWHQWQAPWRADDSLGDENLHSQQCQTPGSRERDRFAPGPRHRLRRESRYRRGASLMQALFCSPGRPTQRLTCASETLTGCWLGAAGSAWETTGRVCQACTQPSPSSARARPGEEGPGMAPTPTLTWTLSG